MNTLPTEIRDQIFLYLTYTDLSNTRELQSMYVQEQTQLSNILIDANNGDVKAAKYLTNIMKYDLNESTFVLKENHYKIAWWFYALRKHAQDEHRRRNPWGGKTLTDYEAKMLMRDYIKSNQDLINKVRLQFEV